MSEFDLEEVFDFFVLSGISDGPRSLWEMQQRLAWAERLLYLAALRTGTPTARSLLEVLERLRGEGHLKIEGLGEQAVYSLTEAGELRLKRERARRHSMASQFVEDREMDGSFQRFLKKGPGERL